MSGIFDCAVQDTPVAVIDTETTGLSPGNDRIVEISVVRIDPGRAPQLVFDSLVNPERRMAGTDVHGITDADVSSAPRFREVAPELLSATQGCVIGSYNIYFDIRFLQFELERAGVVHQLPHFCLMYLRPMLGMGERCRLIDACACHRIEYREYHTSAADALAAAALLQAYRAEMLRLNIQTFRQLAALRPYKFCESFVCSPFAKFEPAGARQRVKLQPRMRSQASEDRERAALAAYWERLKTVLADLYVTDAEQTQLQAEKARTGISTEQMRALHARFFSGIITQFVGDRQIDDREAALLRRAWNGLSALGWAPGE